MAGQRSASRAGARKPGRDRALAQRERCSPRRQRVVTAGQVRRPPALPQAPPAGGADAPAQERGLHGPLRPLPAVQPARPPAPGRRDQRQNRPRLRQPGAGPPGGASCHLAHRCPARGARSQTPVAPVTRAVTPRGSRSAPPHWGDRPRHSAWSKVCAQPSSVSVFPLNGVCGNRRSNRRWGRLGPEGSGHRGRCHRSCQQHKNPTGAAQRGRLVLPGKGLPAQLTPGSGNLSHSLHSPSLSSPGQSRPLRPTRDQLSGERATAWSRPAFPLRDPSTSGTLTSNGDLTAGRLTEPPCSPTAPAGLGTSPSLTGPSWTPRPPVTTCRAAAWSAPRRTGTLSRGGRRPGRAGNQDGGGPRHGRRGAGGGQGRHTAWGRAAAGGRRRGPVCLEAGDADEENGERNPVSSTMLICTYIIYRASNSHGSAALTTALQRSHGTSVLLFRRGGNSLTA